MNKTRIEWTKWPGRIGYTWNPLVGCLHNCHYCYARQMYKRFGWSFAPSFHEERMNEPLTCKYEAAIFVGSVTDIGGQWVKPEWVHRILDRVMDCPQHLFLFLTKNALFYRGRKFPDNAWIGVTCTSGNPLGFDDINPRRFYSFEPLHGPITFIPTCEWAIVGAETGRKPKVPTKTWIRMIVEQCRERNIPLFMKNNLQPYWDGELIQEFPEVPR